MRREGKGGRREEEERVERKRGREGGRGVGRKGEEREAKGDSRGRKIYRVGNRLGSWKQQCKTLDIHNVHTHIYNSSAPPPPSSLPLPLPFHPHTPAAQGKDGGLEEKELRGRKIYRVRNRRKCYCSK